jgi:8-oxo-dGTP pyrophosphatase MutT (NUDIX family)
MASDLVLNTSSDRALRNLDLGQIKPDPAAWDPAYLLVERKPCAVAVVIFICDGKNPHVLFIRRGTNLSSHKGQIGFPGGRVELGDLRPRDTALRETWEEVGLDPASVKVLGGISPVVALDGASVFPIVGVTSVSFSDLRVNTDEVDGIFMVPLEKVLSTNCQTFSFNMFGIWRQSFLYDCGSISVWGLSAEILAKADFKDI